jgi:hypothetical protein
MICAPSNYVLDYAEVIEFQESVFLSVQYKV